MNVYTSPKSDLKASFELAPQRIVLGKILSAFSLLMLFSIIGILQTAVSLYDTFQRLPISSTSDPKEVAAVMSISLMRMVLWILIATPGFFCAVFAISLSSYRSRALFKIWILSSILLLLSFPFGTLFGLILGLVIFFKRHEFQRTRDKSSEKNALAHNKS